MANPNKGARGSGFSQAAVDAKNKRFEESDFAKDVAAFQAGLMPRADFEAKYNPFKARKDC